MTDYLFPTECVCGNKRKFIMLRDKTYQCPDCDKIHNEEAPEMTFEDYKEVFNNREFLKNDVTFIIEF